MSIVENMLRKIEKDSLNWQKSGKRTIGRNIIFIEGSLIEENGEVKYIVLNNISATDYAQILICQNHKTLILVANDKKMLKSAIQVIKERRVIGIPALLNWLLVLYPDNGRLKALKETGDKLFIKRHAFGNVSEEQFNKELM